MSILLPVFGGFCMGVGAPPPDALPAVLFAGPVNATWAANHTDYWREKGIQGFLFSGLMDRFDADLPVAQGDPAAPENTPLVAEIRLAVDRLKEAGIDRNFLRAGLAPEEAWFSNRDMARAGGERFGQAGEFCHRAGLCGIAIDTQPAEFIYDYRWDGYPSGADAVLREGARRFGRHAVYAFLRTCPEGEILILGRPLDAVGPLWFDFFEGIVDAVGAAKETRLHLMVPDTAREARVTPFMRRLDRAGQLVLQRLSEKSRAVWRAQGDLVPALEPLGYERGEAVAFYPFGAFRVQVCAAKLAAPRYVCALAPEGGWWRIDETEARGYAGSKQGGNARVVPSPPVYDHLEVYTLKTPLDTFTRVGAYPFEADEAEPAWVLRGKEGAAVVSWAGIRSPRVLPNRTLSLYVTNLISGERRMVTSHEGKVTLEPFETPSLIENLPLNEWTTPAGLWMGAEEPLGAGRSRAPLRLGCVNRADVALEGILDAAAEETSYSLGTASFPVALPPGGAAVYRRTFQGVLELGAKPRIRLALTTPGGGVTARTVEFEVGPAEVWSAVCDGLPCGGPVLVDAARRPQAPRTEAGAKDVLVSSRNGDLAAYDAHGTLRWRSRFREGFVTAPVAGRMKNGETMVAASSQRGLLRIFGSDGTPIRECPLGAECLPDGLRFANLMGAPFDVLLAALSDGRVLAMPNADAPLWEYHTEGAPYWIGVAPSAEGRSAAKPDPLLATVSGLVFVVSGEPHSIVAALSPAGEPQWTQPLVGAPSCAPLIAHPGGTSEFLIYVGDSAGVLSSWEAPTGLRPQRIDTGNHLPILAVAVADVHPGEGDELLAVDGAAAYCWSLRGDLRWRVSVDGARSLATGTVQGKACVVVSADTGVLTGISGDGKVLWHDYHATDGLIGAPGLADVDGDRRLECVTVSADRTLRVVRLGAMAAAPEAAETKKQEK